MKSNELNLKRQKEFNDLINKMKNDRLDLERQKEIDASDKEFNDLMNKMKNDRLNRLKDDKINQIDETNQIDENDLDEIDSELIKAKLALGDLKPLRLLKPTGLFISRPPDTTKIKDIPRIQKNKKIN